MAKNKEGSLHERIQAAVAEQKALLSNLYANHPPEAPQAEAVHHVAHIQLPPPPSSSGSGLK
jgi:hypothetical protein